MKGILTKLKCITVEPVLFFYLLVIFLESNALQELISVKSCIKLVNPINISDCNNKNQSNFTDAINQEKTSWVRYNSAVLFFFTLISSFYAASWTDKIGRKFTMLIPPLGTILAASINSVLSMYIETSIAYILISSTISGLTFGTVGVIAASFGFITDISEESSRTKRIVILEAMIYIGGTLGIYIGGEFIKYNDYNSNVNGFSQLFMFETCIAILIAFYVLLRIPHQSNDSFEFSEISCGNLFNLDHVKDFMKAVFRSRDSGKRKVVLLLLLASFFIFFGTVVQFTLSYYYVHDLLGWDFTKYSNFNAMQFVVQGCTLIIGTPLFFHLMKIPDHLVALLGIVSKLAAFLTFGLSRSDTLIYVCIGLYMFSEFPIPAIRSILSKTIDKSEIGKIFAFTCMLQNLCFLIGSFSLTSIYKSTMNEFPGLCFEIGAFFQACAFIIITYLYLTRGEVITTYEIMENEDGSTDETCHHGRTSASINND